MAIPLQNLEHTCREIGKLIGLAVDDVHGKKKVGFCLMLFDFGDEEDTGNLTYVSNAERDDMRAVLREFFDVLGGTRDETPADQR